MKFFYTLLLSISSVSSFATTWDVSVGDFSFSPRTVNAIVGDIIRFNWQTGDHTTTCGSALPGTSLPPGASPWNALMDASSTSFSYTLTVAGNYLYGCIPHFAFQMDGNIIVSSTVPVALGIFKAVNNNNSVALTWKTFTEVNTDHFSIRRSIDGINFKEIGKVPAAGNSSIALLYEFTDNHLERYKYIYYELVTVDIDQKESFSEIKVVKNLQAADKLIVALTPNPVSRPGQVQIQFNAGAKGYLDVKVYSIDGKLVLNDKMMAFYGLNNGHLHVCDLQKGVYTIKFQLDGKKEVRKVVVQ